MDKTDFSGFWRCFESLLGFLSVCPIANREHLRACVQVYLKYYEEDPPRP